MIGDRLVEGCKELKKIELHKLEAADKAAHYTEYQGGASTEQVHILQSGEYLLTRLFDNYIDKGDADPLHEKLDLVSEAGSLRRKALAIEEECLVCATVLFRLETRC